jgi:hypothetical protein
LPSHLDERGSGYDECHLSTAREVILSGMIEHVVVHAPTAVPS